ncbi:hypothetical protein NDN08_006932 [Rhodosorus marinus]|uniref:MARVEL domain-containing protein n=1 Tax=Rhodosorus marinus TaxID=101924 RepID=A0AAV8UKM6_9RHOD|nr:hypothetical protein NDN08_006932 [Rhodosorus marinus]
MSTSNFRFRIPRVLGPPPKSGQLSIEAGKTIMQMFVLLASIVVWGAQLDALVYGRRTVPNLVCNASCIVTFIFGPFATLLMILVLLKYPRSVFGQLRSEVSSMVAMFALYIIIVAIVMSNSVPITKTGVVFSWLALFGSMNAVFRVLHTIQEEDCLRKYNETLESYITNMPRNEDDYIEPE